MVLHCTENTSDDMAVRKKTTTIVSTWFNQNRAKSDEPGSYLLYCPALMYYLKLQRSSVHSAESVTFEYNEEHF